MEPIQTPFEFHDFQGRLSICELEILPLTDGRIIVICTELPENKGTNITSFAAELATRVCRQFNIALDNCVWIEHYSPGPRHGPKPVWDLVTFDPATNDNSSYGKPRWRPMLSNDWNAMGIAARE